MRRCLLALLLAAALPGCAGASVAAPAPVRIVLVGDVMLGRGLGAVVSRDGPGVFEHVRHLLSEADLALANLESPLTSAPHVATHHHVLAAPAATAALLAGAGFDAVALANNHTGDSGPEGVADTIAAVEAAGLTPVGAGTVDRAAAPVVLDVAGVMVALLAFDATGLGLPAGDGAAGVAMWNEEAARRAVGSARKAADVVVVGLHGAAPLTGRDDTLETIAQHLAAWGVDVVWGHGAHVPLPVTTATDGERTTVIATGLGNFLFDQHLPATGSGLVLEVLVGPGGVVAYRVGTATHGEGRVRFAGWEPPAGSAALLGLEWWSLVAAPGADAVGSPDVGRWAGGDLTDASVGDADGDGEEDLVVAFRRPFRETIVNAARPDVAWVDAAGHSAHVGVYTRDGAEPLWVAGSLLRPVARLEACDGSVAVAYSTLDDGTVIGVGAWRWNGFGFMAGPDLPGDAVLTCADVDGDGFTDPVVAGRPIED